MPIELSKLVIYVMIRGTVSAICRSSQSALLVSDKLT